MTHEGGRHRRTHNACAHHGVRMQACTIERPRLPGTGTLGYHSSAPAARSAAMAESLGSASASVPGALPLHKLFTQLEQQRLHAHACMHACRRCTHACMLRVRACQSGRHRYRTAERLPPLYVYIYIYIHIYIYIYIYLHIAQNEAFIYIHIYIYMIMYISYVGTYHHMHAYMYVYIYI